MLNASKIKLIVTIYLAIFAESFVFSSVSYAQETDSPEENALTQRLLPNFTDLIGLDYDIHKWDRYVRRFRRDHHLVASMGYEKGYWHVGSFGRIADESFVSRGIDASIQYTFHIQLISKFGYYLGTGGGYYLELEKRDERDFGPSSMWRLPGLIVGLVYNYDSAGRVFADFSGYLSRVTELATANTLGESETISVTGESFDFHVGWDRFLSLNSALRLQYTSQQMWVPSPKNADKYALNAHLKRKSNGGSIGYVFHFL